MGGFNKHPSTVATWEQTTMLSLAVSMAMSELMLANAALERVILCEHKGRRGNDIDIDAMTIHIELSIEQLNTASRALDSALDLSQHNPSPFISDFKKVDPDVMAEEWSTILPGMENVIRNVATDVRKQNTMPMHQFVIELAILKSMTEKLKIMFQRAQHSARHNDLRRALEDNDIQLQANFSKTLSAWTNFMQRFIVDSMIATSVAFAKRGCPALVA